MFIINNIKVRIIYGINILNKGWESTRNLVNDIAMKKHHPITIYWPNIETFIPLRYLKKFIYLSI